MNALRTIIAGVWMADAPTQAAYEGAAQRLLKGEAVQFPRLLGDSLSMATPDARVIAYDDYDDDEQGFSAAMAAEEAVVMIWPIRGLITKADQECGPRGTETLMRMMREADTRDNVRGHLLDIDSGGGEATNMESVARCIAGLQKPTMAWYNGTCASAAYYLACGADAIYASQKTDQVGSIGVMVRMANMDGHYEQMGVKIHEVYATQSTLKNESFLAARQGEYDILRERLLNPYAAQFISTVQEMRPQLEAAEAFQGRVYTTDEAIAIGMIDGMASREEAVAAIFSITKDIDMSLFFGKKQEPEAPAATATPTPAETIMGTLESLEARVGAVTDTLERMIPVLNSIQERVTAQDAEQAAQKAQLSAVTEKIEAIAAKPGAGPAASTAPEKPLIEGKGISIAALEADLLKAAKEGVRLTH